MTRNIKRNTSHTIAILGSRNAAKTSPKDPCRPHMYSPPPYILTTINLLVWTDKLLVQPKKAARWITLVVAFQT